ncbi:hypothetical protein [Noviherbaspirillum massiliense]|uniref:hypothetical protein n=1 Tax=Noviherbaspirillum massiliense TaxID=1465823 RepID=UPI001FE021C2|nr:hypothetical protein [Noviherbaspirillum massiliense]
MASAFAGALLEAFSTGFNTVFLFVTGVFNFSGAAFAVARDEVLAVDAVAFKAVFGAALATVFVGTLLDDFALPAGLATAVFFTAGFAIDLLEAGLVAADFAFFALSVDFAGFFIAFAIESIPTGLPLLRK